MSTKTIELIAAPPAPRYVGDGFRVHNFIPGMYGLDMQRMDPFILMDYNALFRFPPSETPRGVDVHPHRGFETVTIAYKGRIAHHDNAGNSGVIGEGDVQWMTAAAGILHKEYHEEQFSKTGGDFQMVQLWVNLPAQHKMLKPKYQGITHAEIPAYQLPNDSGTIEIIAGQYRDVQGAASTFTPIHLLNAKLRAGSDAKFEFPERYNTGLLVVEGSVRVNDADVVPTDHFALFAYDGTTFTLTALEKSIVLILSGEPIGEPIAAQGPFVMNTREELMQAFHDFKSGKFGVLA
ncbi:MAG TPA: pirin family protein [Saprospiraceae bacterium]|nr:pirin family protein [Saprospiraceae bacterium]HMP15328.1 pirin family protein [Saprospiraceae bacterium]